MSPFLDLLVHSSGTETTSIFNSPASSSAPKTAITREKRKRGSKRHFISEQELEDERTTWEEKKAEMGCQESCAVQGK